MILLVHILLAVSSVLFATYSAFVPSQKKLTISYALTILTLISAGAVVLQSHTNFGHVCLSGLTYLSLIFISLLITRRRLAKQTI